MTTFTFTRQDGRKNTISLKDSPEIYRAYLIKVDMRLVTHFADYILENGEEAYKKLSPTLMMALKIALIICYARPFRDNKGEYIKNGEKIDDYLIKDFLDEELIIHRNILQMRHKEIESPDLLIKDIESFESNIVHIAMSTKSVAPLEFTIVESIKKMSDKISAVADEIANNILESDIGILMQPTNEI